MTNQPNNGTSPQPHDLTPDDLRLVPEKAPRRKHRDTIAVTETQNSDAPDLLIAPKSHRRRKKKHPVRTALLILLLSLLGIIAVAVGTVLVLQARGRASLLPDTPVSLEAPEAVEQDPTVQITDDGRTVTYKGDAYTFNENRTNILCIGIDKESLGLEDNVVGTGGQADTIVLLSIDTVTGDTDILSVSRDTIVDIDLFAEDGSFVGVEKTQICLAYAYGDGREQSCDNTVRAVSRLLYGVPINTYFAIDLSSIATLNDAIGGVELSLLTDFRRTDGTMCQANDIITLQGEEALRYVRARDTEQLDSNNARMQRQTQYLTAFAAKAMNAAKDSLRVPLELYNTVSADSITNLTPSKITFLTTTLVQHGKPMSFSAVPGTVTKGDDGYAEFHVDETALYEQVLDIFYTKQ